MDNNKDREDVERKGLSLVDEDIDKLIQNIRKIDLENSKAVVYNDDTLLDCSDIPREETRDEKLLRALCEDRISDRAKIKKLEEGEKVLKQTIDRLQKENGALRECNRTETQLLGETLAENIEAKGMINEALRISDLWMPANLSEEHRGEGEALSNMKFNFEYFTRNCRLDEPKAKGINNHD